MRNVVKGFQFAGMAVPKYHAGKINSSFTSFHTQASPRPPSLHLPRMAPKTPLTVARRPGRNVAIKGGYKV